MNIEQMVDRAQFYANYFWLFAFLEYFSHLLFNPPVYRNPLLEVSNFKRIRFYMQLILTY